MESRGLQELQWVESLGMDEDGDAHESSSSLEMLECDGEADGDQGNRPSC